MTSTFTFSKNISKKVTAVAWLASRIKQVLFMKIDSADMRIALWAYVGILGAISLMQALEIRAHNFNNLPESHVMAHVLI